jgi:hypothetical protein
MPLNAPLTLPDTREHTLRVGPWKLTLSFWPMQIGGWLTYSLIPCFLWLTDRFVSPEVLWMAMIRPFVGILTTTAIRPLCRKLSARRYSPLLFILWASLAALAVAALDYAVSLWLGVASGILHGRTWDATIAAGLLMMRWISVAIWILLYFTIKQGQRSAALHQTNREAEMMRLRSQVEPHFLFNALNSILAEAGDPEKVRLLTHSLAEHLRFSLKQQDLLYELGEELEALDHYLRVQKVRFEEKLDYVFEIAPGTAEALVPPALVQPLLENALKFGQLTSPDRLHVRIAARVEAPARLLLEVENSGSWVEPDPSVSPSTGIQNLRRRLHLIYGEAARFSLSRSESGVVARISIPLKVPQ